MNRKQKLYRQPRRSEGIERVRRHVVVEMDVVRELLLSLFFFLFFCHISDLGTDQRSQVRGYVYIKLILFFHIAETRHV